MFAKLLWWSTYQCRTWKDEFLKLKKQIIKKQLNGKDKTNC